MLNGTFYWTISYNEVSQLRKHGGNKSSNFERISTASHTKQTMVLVKQVMRIDL